MIHIEEIKNLLSQIIVPEREKNLVELDLIQNIHLEENTIVLELLTLNPTLQAKSKIESEISILFEKNLPPHVLSIHFIYLDAKAQTAQQRKILPGVKKIIAVASGKGGVGKSTLTAALAMSLAQTGNKIGVLDVDIYGPSLPILFDVENAKPAAYDTASKKWIQPVFKNEMALMSIGFFTDAQQAIVWRGPMTSKALTQMVSDVYWGELDYLLIDLPPGTGDIHISLLGILPETDVILVSTPQKMALADAVRGLQMFRLPQFQTKILGLVENFSVLEAENQSIDFFGSGGVANLATEKEVPFLGKIPMLQTLREACDQGKLYEYLLKNKEIKQIFIDLVQKAYY